MFCTKHGACLPVHADIMYRCVHLSDEENLKKLQAQYPERKTKGHYDSAAYFEAGRGEGTRSCTSCRATQGRSGLAQCLGAEKEGIR